MAYDTAMNQISEPKPPLSDFENGVKQDGMDLEKNVLIEMMRLNEVILGIVLGLVCGIGLFVATNWLLLRGGTIIGPHLKLLAQFFPGYEVTFLGSLIGLGYGFGVGFAAGWLTARLYNWLAGLRDNRRSASAVNNAWDTDSHREC